MNKTNIWHKTKISLKIEDKINTRRVKKNRS